MFGKRALAGLIRIHDTSPVRTRPGLSSADSRYRAERVPGDRWFAQKRGKVIAGRRNVRPACRARSRTLRRTSPRTSCWWQRYRGEEGWNAWVKIKHCLRLWMLAPGVPSESLTFLQAPSRDGRCLAADEKEARNEHRPMHATGLSPSTPSFHGEATMPCPPEIITFVQI